MTSLATLPKPLQYPNPNPNPKPNHPSTSGRMGEFKHGQLEEQRQPSQNRQQQGYGHSRSCSGSSSPNPSFLNEPKIPTAPKLGENATTIGDKSGDQGRETGEDLDLQVGGNDTHSPQPPQPPRLSDLNGLAVCDGGNILNTQGRPIGEVVEGDPADLIGQIVSQDGEILDEDGDLIGLVDLLHPDTAEARMRMLDSGQLVMPEEAIEDDVESSERVPEDEMRDISMLEGLTCNKLGEIVTAEGIVVGELIEGNLKRICREEFQLDGQGQFRDYRGNIIGKARPIVVEEEAPAPFADQRCLIVTENGWIQDEKSKRVGNLVDGDCRQLVGLSVDEDGDILDQRGNVIGHAEPWEEPNEVNFAAVEGLTPNKQGVVFSCNTPIAVVIDGDRKLVAGRPVDKDGRIRDDVGEVIGKVNLIAEGDRQGMGQFSGLGDLVATASGSVEDVDGVVVGNIVEGDPKSLRGAPVNEAGEVLDQYGHITGRAERCEPPEEDFSMLDGMRVNKLGHVVDEEGLIVGHIVAGMPKKMVGKCVDKEGRVWSDTGKLIGQAEPLAEKAVETPDHSFSELKRIVVGKDGMVLDHSRQVVGRLTEGDQLWLVGRAVGEDGKIMDDTGSSIGHAERWIPEGLPHDVASMGGCQVNFNVEVQDAEGDVMHTLAQENLQSLHIENAGKVPQDGVNEDQLVNDMTPLIEEAGKVLQECKAALETIDPEGHLVAMIEARGASQKVTLGYQLADLLQQLTPTVLDVMKSRRRLLAVIPHAQGQASRLCSMLSEILFQIVTAVGLLVCKLIGLYSKFLDSLRLGGLLRTLLTGSGVDKLLESCGLDAVREALELKVRE
ncbi:hypothetical protein BDV12DRAFT_207313 [Aspergillus spectabilis]